MYYYCEFHVIFVFSFRQPQIDVNRIIMSIAMQNRIQFNVQYSGKMFFFLNSVNDRIDRDISIERIQISRVEQIAKWKLSDRWKFLSLIVNNNCNNINKKKEQSVQHLQIHIYPCRAVLNFHLNDNSNQYQYVIKRLPFLLLLFHFFFH